MPARPGKCLNKIMKPSSYENIEFRIRFLLCLADFIGAIIFLPARLARFLRNEKLDPAKIKKIIVYRLDGIGDLALSLPALANLRAGFPDAHITLVTGPWAADLARIIKYYDELIIYDSYLFGMFRKNSQFSLKNEIAFFRKTRSEKYDLGIDLRGDILSIIPLALSCAHFRYAKVTQGGGFLLTNPVNIKDLDKLPEADRNNRIIAALGIDIKERDIELPVGSAREEKAKPLVVIAPEALYKWKAWPKERFKELESALAEVADVEVKSIEGKMDFTELIALIRNADLVIGNDSSLIHIASLFRIPLIQLFGPGIPKRFGHFHNNTRVFQDTSCPHQPCVQRDCKNKANWCMEKISVDEVLRAARELLQTR